MFRLSGLGDVVLASPAIAALATEPERFHLTLLTLFDSSRSLSCSARRNACIRELPSEPVENAAWQLLHQSHASTVNA